MLVAFLWLCVAPPAAATSSNPGPVLADAATDRVGESERTALGLQQRDDRRLCGMAAGHALLAHRATFDRMHGRLDAFGDWVFGWMSSLMASYELFSIGVTEAIDWSRDGEGSMQDAVNLVWAGYIDERFEAIVIAPALRGVSAADPAIEIVAKLRDQDAALARARAAQIEALFPPSSIEAARLIDRYATPRAPVDKATAHPDATSVPHLVGGQVDVILLRSLRPYGSRLVGLTLRSGVVEIVAAAALVRAYDVMGDAFSGAVGLVVSGAIGAALAGGFDYSTNRVHAWLGRDAFMDELAVHLDEAEARAADETYQDVLAAFDHHGACPSSFAEARARAPMLAFIEPRR